MRARRVYFTAPRRVEISDETLPRLAADDVLVKVELSGISAGTEMLLYRGEVPDAAGEGVDSVSAGLSYPVSYGYCSVGRVDATGSAVGPEWEGRRVFAFQPHATAFQIPTKGLVPIPDDVTSQDAIFLANAETAVTLVLDAAPLLGERVLVLGQGVVGLLAAGLLRRFPLACLATADLHAVRRAASASLGVSNVLDPADPGFVDAAKTLTAGAGYDAVLELTGNPLAMNHAIELTAFTGRVIAGSWYGSKPAPLNLGGRFHRSRIRLHSSQVSTIAPELSGRWDKKRRFASAWEAIRRLEPRAWITHRFPIDRAADAYRLLDTAPASAIQVVLHPGIAAPHEAQAR